MVRVKVESPIFANLNTSVWCKKLALNEICWPGVKGSSPFSFF